MCPHQTCPQNWRLERQQRPPTPLLSKASQMWAAARPQQLLMGVPLALLPRQKKTASPPNSTASDKGSVAGADQAEPQLHPGAHQPPVLLTESQQQPAAATPAGEQHIQSHAGHLGTFQRMTPCVALLQASRLPPEILQAAVLSLYPLSLLTQGAGSAPIAEVAAGIPAVTLPKLDAADELLAGNSASSTKQRHGGNVYDLLVQELKALKLQHKALPRQLSELQRNSSMLVVLSEQQAAAIVQLQRQVAALQSAQDPAKARSPAAGARAPCNTSVARSGEITVDMIELAQKLPV